MWSLRARTLGRCMHAAMTLTWPCSLEVITPAAIPWYSTDRGDSTFGSKPVLWPAQGLA